MSPCSRILTDFSAIQQELKRKKIELQDVENKISDQKNKLLK